MGRSGTMMLFCVLLGCANPTEDFIAEAKNVHHMSIKISDEVANRIDEIAEHTKGLPSTYKTALMDSVRELTIDLAEWKDSVIEVPGDEEHHHHDHGHQPSADLTPKMVLDVQEELRIQIIQLNDRTQHILNEVNEQNGSES